MKNDKRDGHGVYTYASGSKYDGEWKAGKKHGQGVFTFADGTKYEGEYKNNLKHGHGVFTFADGTKYEGEHKNDLKHGQGVLTFPDGEKFDGKWKNDKFEKGHVVFTFREGRVKGDKYNGKFKNNKKEGHGVYTRLDGMKYEGEYKNDEKHGQGVLTYANGDKYVGKWKANKKHGHGVMRYANGDKYDGEFKNGALEGHGVMTYANGDKYNGKFKNSQIEGNGVMTYANGNKYEGRWRNDLRDGRGVMTYANGDKYVGEWKNDKREGVKKAEKQRILYVDNWITKKAFARQLKQIVEHQHVAYKKCRKGSTCGTKEIVGSTKLKKFDIIRNIQKYDPQSITGLQQNNTFQSLLQKLEKAYKKYMKTKFKIRVYTDKSKIPKNIFDYINKNMFDICRREYLLLHPTFKSSYIFVSQGGTSQNPVIGGVAVVSPYSGGGSGYLIGLDTNTTSGVEVETLCSHMGQGAAILDEIRRWMVKFDKNMTVLELGPLDGAIPFYRKYGFKYFSDAGRMVMNVKQKNINHKNRNENRKI